MYRIICYIEVKITPSKTDTEFFVTKNELEVPKHIRRVTLYIEYMMQKDYNLNSIEQQDVYQIILY